MIFNLLHKKKNLLLRTLVVMLLSTLLQFGESHIKPGLAQVKHDDDTITIEPDIKNLELNLEESLRLGLIYSPVLKMSKTSIEEARAQLQKVRSAYWPKVTARAGYEWMDDHEQFEFALPEVLRDTLAKSKAYFDLDAELAQARAVKSAYLLANTDNTAGSIEGLLVGQGVSPQDADYKTSRLNSPLLWGEGDQDINTILASNTTADPIASWSQTYNSAKADIPTQIVEDIKADKAFVVKANVSMPLFTFGKLGHQSRAAEAEVARKKIEHRKTEREVTLLITRAFYEALYSKSVKEALDDLSAKTVLFQDSMDAMSGDEDIVPSWDFNAYNALVQRVKGLVKKAEMLFESRKDNLKAVIGVRDPLVNLRLYGGYREFRLLENFNLKNCISYALKNRLEINEIMARISKSEEVIKTKRAEYLPQLNLLGQFAYTKSFKDDWSSTIEDQDKSEWIFGVGADLNVFDGFERSAIIGEYTAKIKKLQAEKSHIKQNIKSQVSDAYYDVFAYYERRKSLDASKNLLVKSVQDSMDSFSENTKASAGLNDVIRLMESELSIVMERLTEERNYFNAFARLKRSLGYENADTQAKYEGTGFPKTGKTYKGQ